MKFLFLFLIVGQVVSRVFISGELRYGEFAVATVSYMPHLIEMGMLSVFIFGHLLVFRWKNVMIPLPVWAALLIFSSALLLAPMSSIPLASAYAGVRGILYTVAGIVLFLDLRGRENLRMTLEHLSLIIFVVGILSCSVVAVGAFSLDVLISEGVTGGQYVLVGYLYVYLVATSQRNLMLKVLIISFVVAACFYGNSFSSLLALICGCIFSLFIQRKFVTGTIICLFAVFSSTYVYGLLEQGVIDEVFNKSAFSLLSGSGRFIVYEVIWDYIQHEGLDLFGAGFFAERSVMLSLGEDLPWHHTAHNSILSMALGLGWFGVLLYFFYLFAWLKQVPSAQRARFGSFFAVFVFSMIAYGFTSVTFPGTGNPIHMYCIVVVMLIVDSAEKKQRLIASKWFLSGHSTTPATVARLEASTPTAKRIN